MTDKDSEKITTFHRAAFIGNATLLTSLLDEGVDVNAAIDQVTPLHLAAGQGHDECVKLLLNRGANISAVDKENMSALHRAVKNNHQSIVEQLVKQQNYKEIQESREKSRMDLTNLFVHNGATLFITFNNGVYHIEHSGINKSIKTTRADLCHRSGKWYYEVTIKTGLPSKIGWMSIDSNIDNPLGLGGDSFSYAYDGRRKYKWHSRRAESYGKKWTVGDVVGCYADLDQGTISFSLNGESLGEAFTGVDGTRGLFPAVSLSAWDQVSLNFGTDTYKHYTNSQFQPLISPDIKYNSPLHIAAIHGREECGEVLLENGADVNERNWEGCTALHLAASHKHPEFIEMLLDKGASTEERQAANSQTALHKAAYFGEAECIEVLLDHGASIDSLDKQGRTPVFYAVIGQHMECLQVLIDRGANNYPEDRHARGLLHVAAAQLGNGSGELIAFLLEVGHDVDAVDESGKTSLHWAVMSGNVDAARELIAKGANVNHSDNQQTTPLHMCGTRNSVECTQLLLDHGADADLSSALHAAASLSADNVVSLLLQAPSIDVDGHSETQPTALFAAASLGDLETAKLLLEHFADPNARCASASNRISLHGACESGFVQMVKLLLEHKALPNLEDDNAETPLHLAAKNGHLACLNELLKSGGDANLKNNNGATPLDYAALSGHTDIVMRLIEIGAEMNYKQPLMAWTQPTIQGDIPPPVVWGTITAFQNKYYLVGGMSEHSKPSEIHVYSLEYVPSPKVTSEESSKPASDTASQSSDHDSKNASVAVWKKLQCTGDVPEGRYRHKAIPHHHELYILGGYTIDTVRGRLVGFDVIHVLDLVTLQWSQRNASGIIPPALRGFSANKMHNKAYIYGGKHQMRPTKKMFVLDMDTLEWAQVEATAKEGVEPIERANHCGVFFGKRLFLLGGIEHDEKSPDSMIIDVFDPETMTWQTPPAVIGTPANVGFEWALVVRNYQVLVFGGFEDTPFWVFNYDEVHNTVTWVNPKVSGSIPRSRVSQCGDIADNKLAMFGGSYKTEVFDDVNILITEEESFPLESDLRKVVDSKDFHDVEIILEDRNGTTSKFFAHKIILDTRSTVFRALIAELEAKQSPPSKVLQIRLSDISRGVLALLLEFVYTDSVRAPPQMALELVHVTKKYLPDRHLRLVHQIIRDVGHTDNHQAVLQEQVYSAFNNPKHSDITFVLPDKSKFYAHKVILGSRCDHFRALFSSGFDESKVTQIDVTSVKQEIFLKVMQYLYSNHTEIAHDDAVDLLIAADLYRIPDLIASCEELLMRHLDDDNVIGMFQVAEMYNAAQLQSCTLAYIMRDYERISQSDDYKALTKSQLNIIENKRYDLTSRSSHSSGSEHDAHEGHADIHDTHTDNMNPWALNNNNNNNNMPNNNNLPNNNNNNHDGEDGGEKKFSSEGSESGTSSTVTLNNNNIENNSNNNTNVKKSKTIKRKAENTEENQESSSTAMTLLALTTAVITASIFWFAYKRVQRE